MSTWQEERRAHRRYVLQRREAVRPLKEMLKDTRFSVRYAGADVHWVLIELGYPSGWDWTIQWSDCADRQKVAAVQRKLLKDAERFLERAWSEVVEP